MNERERAELRDRIARERLRRELTAEDEREEWRAEREAMRGRERVLLSDWRREVQRDKRIIELAFGDLLPCPGCGRRMEPNRSDGRRGKLYCSELCGARTRHYVRTGRERPELTRTYAKGAKARARDREIVRRRAEGESLVAIGNRYGISKQRVRQILTEHEKRAVA